MSEQPLPRYIGGTDLYRFCMAKQVQDHCFRCGYRGWDLHDTESHIGMAGLLVGRDGLISDKNTPLITLSCQNCGGLWAMVRGIVQEWVDANPAPETADE